MKKWLLPIGLCLGMTGCAFVSGMWDGLTGVQQRNSDPAGQAAGSVARDVVKSLPFGNIALTLLGLGTAGAGAGIVRGTGRRNRRVNRKKGRRRG